MNLWISTKNATGLIEVKDNLIINACPYWRKWIGRLWKDFENTHKYFDLKKEQL
jgi:hypothetical protein